MQKWSDSNVILIYSIHNEGKCVVTEKFINTFEGKIYFD